METEDSQQQDPSLLDDCYDDPSQLSQLLRQRSGAGNPPHFTASTEHRLFVSPTKPVVVATDAGERESRNITSRRAGSHSRYVKPSLAKHNTAPNSTNLATERVRPERMHQSFNAIMDAPGDTQPDSQIYKEWTSGIFGSGVGDTITIKGQAHGQGLFDLPNDQGADTPTDNPDVTGSSQDQLSPTVTNPTIVQDDDHDMHLHYHGQGSTSPLKFETPAMAGRKRDSDGQVLSSDLRTTTPGTTLNAAAFFGAGVGGGGIGNAMSLTQVFNATQAQTSPIVGGNSEDAVFQRPSPNFTDRGNSSPMQGMPVSSPIKAATSDVHMRSSSEPRSEYVTMKESQERRVWEPHDNNPESHGQSSWDEPTLAEKRAAARTAKQKFEEHAGKSFAKVTAPSFTPQPRRKGRTLLSVSKTAKHQKPTKKRNTRRNAYDGPYDDDENSEPDEQPPQPVPIHEETETAQAILSSADNRQDYDHTRVQVPNTSSHPTRTLSGRSERNTPPASPTLQTRHESQMRRASHQRLPHAGSPAHSSKGTDKIIDSQPDTTMEIQARPRPKSLLVAPSSPSLNPYSIDQTTLAKNTGYTSQGVPSSVLSLPPKSSSRKQDADIHNTEDEQRVPSSPPALDPDEVVYDEHSYEEHHCAGENEDDMQSDHSLKGEEDQLPQFGPDHDTDQDDDMIGPRTEGDFIPESDRVEEEDNQGTDVLDDANSQSNDLHQDSGKAATVEDRHDGNELIQSSHPEDGERAASELPPRLQRQSTIPESDGANESQYPGQTKRDTVSGKDHGSPMQTNDASEVALQPSNTERYHTAPDGHSPLQPNNSNIATPLKAQVDTADQTPQFRSLQDIANQQNTQSSVEMAEVEIPQLSFSVGSQSDPSTLFPKSLQMPPAAKKRKVTYSAKKMTYLESQATLQSHSRSASPSSNVHVLADQEGPSITEREEHAPLEADAEGLESSAICTTPLSPLRKTKGPKKDGGLEPAKKAVVKNSRASRPRVFSLHVRENHIDDPEATPAKDNVPPARVHEKQDELDKITGHIPQHTPKPRLIQGASECGDTLAGDVLVPNRVIASWPGLGFFPATCLGKQDSRQFKIRYDDGNQNVLDRVHVKAFDLCVGDQLKVDQAGMKKSIFVVAGFKDKINPGDADAYPLTDRQGYATVILEPKQRESNATNQAEDASNLISVPMENVYFTTQLWAKLKGRAYKFRLNNPSSGASSGSHRATPTATVEDSLTTSLSHKDHAVIPLLKETVTRAGSVASSTRTSMIFANMAFATTCTHDSTGEYRDGLAKLIMSNGGQIIEDGFHELFALPDGGNTSEHAGLVMKDEYRGLRLVALITDSHCRSIKYIQALALNLPCIHDRWLRDSITAGVPINFPRYLLPAGHSTFLQGAVRSRIMPLYDLQSEETTFQKMFQGRDCLLDNQNILMVIGKGKKETDRKKPFFFLTHALGPKTTGRCHDISSAKEMLQAGVWDWLYVEGGRSNVHDMAAALFGEHSGPSADTFSFTKVKKGRKRKYGTAIDIDERAGDAQDVLVRKGEIGGKVVRVVGDEFIVQSLILGALAEEG